jgi:hypothetical protein
MLSGIATTQIGILRNITSGFGKLQGSASHEMSKMDGITSSVSFVRYRGSSDDLAN